jgi:hypothetical protein
MTGVKSELNWGWEPEPLGIEVRLADVMFDLDPRWEDWGAELAAS